MSEFTVEPGFEDMAEALGTTVMLWGFIETCITDMVELIDTAVWCPLDERRGLPRPLNRRIRFLNRAFGEAACLGPLHQRASPLLKHFAGPKLEREILIHGFLSKGEGNTWIAHVVTTKGRRGTYRKEVVTDLRVAKLNTQLLILGPQFRDLSISLVERLEGEKIVNLRHYRSPTPSA